MTADADTGLGLTDPEGGYYGLVAVGGDDVVRVSVFGREAAAFELVDAAAVDDVNIAFALMGGKVGGGIELASGAHYGEMGWPDMHEGPWRTIADGWSTMFSVELSNVDDLFAPRGGR